MVFHWQLVRCARRDNVSGQDVNVCESEEASVEARCGNEALANGKV